jgi:cytochrome c-type biogenesis protein CcmH/NrfG
MRRDTSVFMLAGTIFGLVVGYMAAQWGVLPSPAPAAAASRGATSSASVRVDPNEVAALEALAALDQALARNPAHRLALYNRVVALLRLGRAQEAVAAWQELLKRHPDDPQVERLRARIERIRAGAEAGR